MLIDFLASPEQPKGVRTAGNVPALGEPVKSAAFYRGALIFFNAIRHHV